MKNDKFIWGFFGFLVIVILFTNPFNANNNKVTVDILSKYQQFNTSVDVNSLSTSECKEIAEEYIYLARQMAKNDKYEKAIESLNNAIEVYPQHEYIYNELADLYLSKAFFENSNDIREVKTSMDFEQAINNAKKNISMHPNYFSTYEALINIYSSIKDYENATKIAFDACNKNPSNKNLCKRVADLYLLQGKKQETIEFYKNIARKTADNQSSWIYKQIAAIYRAEGKCNQSIYYYKKAYKLNSSPAILEELMQSCSNHENVNI